MAEPNTQQGEPTPPSPPEPVAATRAGGVQPGMGLTSENYMDPRLVQALEEAQARQGRSPAPPAQPETNGATPPDEGEEERREAEGTQQQPRRRSREQKRINELMRDAAAARQREEAALEREAGTNKRIEDLVRENERLKAGRGGAPGGNPGDEPELPDPTDEKYSGDNGQEKWLRDRDRVMERRILGRVNQQVEQRLKQAEKTQNARAQARAQQDSAQAITRRFAQRQAEARERHDDWDDVIEAAPNISDDLDNALLHVEDGPELMYYLAKHPEEIAKLNEMPSGDVIFRLGKLSTGLSGARRASASRGGRQPDNAADPSAVTPLRGGGVASPSGYPSKGMMDPRDYARRRRQGWAPGA